MSTHAASVAALGNGAEHDDARATSLEVTVPGELIERIAERAAEIVLERLEPQQSESEFLTVDEAAEFIRGKRQRVYDLLSDGRLKRFKDGTRVLVRRSDLVAHLRPSGAPGRIDREVGR